MRCDRVFFAVFVFLICMIIAGCQKQEYAYNNTAPQKHILGNQNATVKVVEFSDLQCPACKTASSYPQRLVNEFGGNISIEFKHFPLSFHKYAFKAAEASECASDQGKFWEYLEIGFKNQPKLSESDLKGYAKELSLDTALFDVCLDSGAKKAVVEDYMREGYFLDIPGTPTFFVNGKKIETNRYEEIKDSVEEELKK